MPRYDYNCLICDLHYETDAKVDAEVFCPICGGETRRVITKMPLHSYSNRPNERPWGTGHWRTDKKKGGRDE